ncbi:hypothetical protein T439DRAFT_326569 [Meredithblackwellia eburnea MCA 4105]
MRCAVLVALLLNLAIVALAQRSTYTDAAGNEILVSLTTSGRTTRTSTISTILTAPDQANPQVVAQPASTCTTAGCPVAPTTYTQNGVIVTFIPTTPTTPVPTWSASGSIIGISQYITTTYTASLISSAHPNPLRMLSDWTVMTFVGVVGGLIGAAIVL